MELVQTCEHVLAILTKQAELLEKQNEHIEALREVMNKKELLYLELDKTYLETHKHARRLLRRVKRDEATIIQLRKENRQLKRLYRRFIVSKVSKQSKQDQHHKK
jgi:hypothetical protein